MTLGHLLSGLPCSSTKLARGEMPPRLREGHAVISPDEGPKWLSPIVTHDGTYVFPYILYWVPDVGKWLIVRLVLSGDEVMRMIAAWHVFRRSFQDRQYAPLADAFLGDGENYRKLAADVAANSVTHDEFRYRAEWQLRTFFNDENKEVRVEASDVFRNIEPREFDRYYDLAESYVGSRAFEEESSFAFFHALESATCDVQALVIRVAEKLISNFQQEGTAGNRKLSDLHQLQDLIKREYSASEREPTLRTRLLDVIDLLLSQELYGRMRL
jgi:hypothetical protein